MLRAQYLTNGPVTDQVTQPLAPAFHLYAALSFQVLDQEILLPNFQLLLVPSFRIFDHKITKHHPHICDRGPRFRGLDQAILRNPLHPLRLVWIQAVGVSGRGVVMEMIELTASRSHLPGCGCGTTRTL